MEQSIPDVGCHGDRRRVCVIDTVGTVGLVIWWLRLRHGCANVAVGCDAIQQDRQAAASQTDYRLTVLRV